jgi:hypothetical protein
MTSKNRHGTSQGAVSGTSQSRQEFDGLGLGGQPRFLKTLTSFVTTAWGVDWDEVYIARELAPEIMAVFDRGTTRYDISSSDVVLGQLRMRGRNISGTSTSRLVPRAASTGCSGTCRSGWSRESTRTTRSMWDQSAEGRKVYEKRRRLRRMLGREYARERLKVVGIMLARWRSSVSCSASSGLLSASRCG